MMNPNLVVALVLIAVSWVAIARALAVWDRRRPDLAALASVRLAAKTAPWRSPPPNRVLSSLPENVGRAS
ncbi:MAG: hypothetical protein QOG07_1612 [Pseudonocardiales bacterium]|nr:hypothetical protein [Pseudonocardiales bacterium]